MKLYIDKILDGPVVSKFGILTPNVTTSVGSTPTSDTAEGLSLCDLYCWMERKTPTLTLSPEQVNR